MSEQAPSASGLLDERELALLDFERRSWPRAGGKEQAIRDRFGVSPARYYQLLGALIDSPRALAHDPLLVKRLRRLRESRLSARASHRLGASE